MKSLKVTFPEIRAIVSTNDKQRFSLIPISDTTATPDPANPANDFSDDPSAFLIRANQGHSMSSVASEGLLTPLTPSTSDLPPLCVHGTTAAAWPAILAAGGLRPMGRNHVHLAAGLPEGFARVEEDGGDVTAAKEEKTVQPPPVISGMRNSSRVLVYVDLRKALEAGVPFWLSANGVVLTEGDKERGGLLGVEFFERVEDRKAGRVVKDSTWDG
ncbi:putative trna 2phosphotransferase 1 [Diplodia seriata]|uniref:Putative trna 2phosphotransferase 1 n=1 Tax=Diplodia seriata TaxID=420778 RepID=A0A0G2G1T0_9PEZI|nr:putative trna 2phosphotransferase 1 [Diplodia seriata]